MQEVLPYMAMLCIWGWSQNLLSVGGVPISPRVFLGEYIHGQGEGFMATCDSVLVELWVWSEVICLLVIWLIESRGQSMGNPQTCMSIHANA